MGMTCIISLSTLCRVWFSFGGPDVLLVLVYFAGILAQFQRLFGGHDV